MTVDAENYAAISDEEAFAAQSDGWKQSFFLNSPQSEASDATGFKGFYYHFLHMQNGRRVRQCELSPLDTALLLAGILTAGAYFTNSTVSQT